MKKKDAIKIFGSVKALANAVGYTPSYFYQLSDPLKLREADRITGAALRLGQLSNSMAKNTNSENGEVNP